MAVIPVVFDNGTYDTVSNVITLTYASNEPVPPPPANVREDLFYLGPRFQVTFRATLPKPVEKPQTAVGGVEQADGTIQWFRYTWNGTAWSNPVKVKDADGNPT